MEVKVSFALFRLAASLFEAAPVTAPKIIPSYLYVTQKPRVPPPAFIVPTIPSPLLFLDVQGFKTLGTFSDYNVDVTIRLGTMLCVGVDSEELFFCSNKPPFSETEEEEKKVEEDSVVDKVVKDFSLQGQLHLTRSRHKTLDHMLLELTLFPLKLRWDERSYLDLDRLFYTSLGALLKPETSTLAQGLNIKSCHQQNCIPLPLISCDITVTKVELVLPLKQFHLRDQHGKALSLAFGPFEVKSGDFIEDPRTHSLLLRACGRQTSSGSKLGQPQAVLLSIHALQLLLTSEESEQALLHPLLIQCALDVSQKKDSMPLAGKLAVHTSPLAVIVTEIDLLSILEVIQCFLKRWMPSQLAFNEGPSSHLPKKNSMGAQDSGGTAVSLLFDSFDITLLGQKTANVSSSPLTLFSLLTAYEKTLLKRGAGSRVVDNHTMILERRLIALGFTITEKEALLADFGSSLEENSAASSTTLMLLSERWTPILQSRGRINHQPHLLSLKSRLFQVDVGSNQQFKPFLIVSLRDCILFDADFIPILALDYGRDSSYALRAELSSSSGVHDGKDTGNDFVLDISSVELRYRIEYCT